MVLRFDAALRALGDGAAVRRGATSARRWCCGSTRRCKGSAMVLRFDGRRGGSTMMLRAWQEVLAEVSASERLRGIPRSLAEGHG
jgi:hypothetical protein